MSGHNGMRDHRATILTAATILALWSCRQNDVTQPITRLQPKSASRSQAPSAFTWLAPLGNGVGDPNTFDAGMAPRVEVCAWVAGACAAAPIAQFSTNPAPGEGLITINAIDGRYDASWNLLSTSLTTRKTYRIRVLQSSIEIGAISVDVVRGRWAFTQSTGTLAPLVAANSLPIRFYTGLSLGQVAQVIDASGGSVTLASGAQVDVPAGAVRGSMEFELADTLNVVGHYAQLSQRSYNLRIVVSDPSTDFSDASPIVVSLPIQTAPPVGSDVYVRARLFVGSGDEYWIPAQLVGSALRFTITPSGLEDVRDFFPNRELRVTIDPEAVGSTGAKFASHSASRSTSGGGTVQCRDMKLDNPPALPLAISCDSTVLRLSPSSKAPQQGDVAVVLVHGWSHDIADGDDFLDQEEGRSCPVNWLGLRICRSFAPALPAEVYFQNLLPQLESALNNQAPILTFTYQSYRDFRDSGDSLAIKLLQLQSANNLSGVVLVGHSMGGLVARRAAADLGQTAGSNGLIRGIITLATPHNGTPYAALASLAGFLKPALGTAGALSLRSGLPGPKEAPIYAYAGDLTNRVFASTADTTYEFLFMNLCNLLGSPWVRGCITGANDGVVPLTSALPTNLSPNSTAVFARDHTEMSEAYPIGLNPTDQMFGQLVSDLRSLITPTISIVSLMTTNGQSSVPANASALHGQVDVILNVQANGNQLRQIDLFLGSSVVATQMISSANGQLSSPIGPFKRATSMAPVVLSFSTTRYPPGRYPIVARMTLSSGAQVSSAPVNVTIVPEQIVTTQTGDTQMGVTSTRLPSPLVVRVTQANGARAVGTVVTWSVLSGGGSISTSTTITNQLGQAQVNWTLGSTVGTQTVSAMVQGTSPIQFSATASNPNVPLSISGMWNGTYSWNCDDPGDGSRIGSTSIQLALTDAGDGTIAGTATYPGGTSTVAGTRYSSVNLGDFGLFSGIVSPAGRWVALNVAADGKLVLNSWIGLVMGDELAGATLNGDRSGGGCSASFGPAGWFLLNR